MQFVFWYVTPYNFDLEILGTTFVVVGLHCLVHMLTFAKMPQMLGYACLLMQRGAHIPKAVKLIDYPVNDASCHSLSVYLVQLSLYIYKPVLHKKTRKVQLSWLHLGPVIENVDDTSIFAAIRDG